MNVRNKPIARPNWWSDDDERRGQRLISLPWGEWTKADSDEAGRLLTKAATQEHASA